LTSGALPRFAWDRAAAEFCRGGPMDSRHLRGPWATLAIPIAIAGAWALVAPAAGAYGLALGVSALAVWAILRSSGLSRRLREAEAAMMREASERRGMERTLAEQKERLKMVIESERRTERSST